jgi:hypothetical protein
MFCKAGYAYTYAGDDPVNKSDPSGDATVGFCVGAGAAALIGPSVIGEGCLTRTVLTPNDDIGWVGTGGGGGAAGLSVFANGSIQISNADFLGQLRGPFAYSVLSVGDFYGGTVVVSWGQDSQNQNIFTIDIGAGISFNAKKAVAPAPFVLGGGVTDTGVTVVRDWWEADPLRWVWDGIASAEFPGSGVAYEVSRALARAESWLSAAKATASTTACIT